jgi:hypothetical protein
MGDFYKLVFRGEVLEGQHPAVVRKRLSEAADFNDAALDKLFSGRPVVLKREADTATAARFQALFRKAGARLRVLPVEAEDEMSVSAPAESPSEQSAEPSEETTDGLELLPAGSNVLREEERVPWQPRDIDTGGLSLEGARFLIPEDVPAPDGPDVSHLTVAEVGSDLGPRRTPPQHIVQAPDFPLAPVGEDLAPRGAPSAPAVDVADVDFEVAPAGSDLGQRKPPAAPVIPDISHLNLSEAD